MVTSSVQGASVEGVKLSLKTRQFYPIPPKRDPQTKKTVFGFKLGINGTAHVHEAYASADLAIYETSMLMVGDAVQGQSVQGWSFKPFGDPNISRGSGSHSANFLTIGGGCYARVVLPPKEMLDSKEFMAKNPPITPRLRGVTVCGASSEAVLTGQKG